MTLSASVTTGHPTFEPHRKRFCIRRLRSVAASGAVVLATATMFASTAAAAPAEPPWVS